MKKVIAILGMALTYATSQAQEGGPHIYEAKELAGAGYVILNSGDTIKGDILYWPNKYERVWIQVNPTDKKRTEYRPGQIKQFRFVQTNRLFESLQESSDGKAKDSSFYERINSAQLKFGIYKQFHTTGKMVGGKLEGWETNFISINGHLSLTNIGGKTLRPMNEKLATYLSDCPDLQQKVSSEQEGYKMPMVMNTDKKIGILMKIAEEYESCGK